MALLSAAQGEGGCVLLAAQRPSGVGADADEGGRRGGARRFQLHEAEADGHVVTSNITRDYPPSLLTLQGITLPPF